MDNKYLLSQTVSQYFQVCSGINDSNPKLIQFTVNQNAITLQDQTETLFEGCPMSQNSTRIYFLIIKQLKNFK